MVKKAYTSPSLHAIGGIESITGTIGCYDVLPGDGGKGIGYASDTKYKFIPVCDLNDGPDVS